MRIQVIPSELRALAARWQRAAQTLEEIGLQVQRAWSNLDWEVRHDAALEALVIQARRQVLALQEEALRLARFLEERAAAFEQADQEGSMGLAHVTGGWIAAMGGPEALRVTLAPSIPVSRVQSYLRLGSLIGGPSPRWGLLRVELEEQRALVDFGAEALLSRLKPLGLLKDLVDTAQIPAWQRRVDEALQAWEAARRQFGARSPQAQSTYGRYLEALIFQMPFFGTGARALLAVLKVVGRMYPVE